MSREVAVCAVADVHADRHCLVRVGRREFGVFEVDGSYYLLPNACPHQNGPLCRGAVTGTVAADAASGWRPYWVSDGEVVVCPWHSQEFEIRTGRCLADSRVRLRVYPATSRDGMIVAELPD